MTRYIYKNRRLRCKVNHRFTYYFLQLQERKFLFWSNVYEWRMVKEGFWGEESLPMDKLVTSFAHGEKSISYKTGSFDLIKIVYQFFEEYLNIKQSRRIIKENLK